MKGVTLIHQEKTRQPDLHVQEAPRLLLHSDEMEIMVQRAEPGSIIWLTPGTDPLLEEFFYLLSGVLVLHLDEGITELHAGEAFCIKGINRDIRIHALESTELLYVVNRKMYDEMDQYQAEMNRLIREIDLKDNFTVGHSRNVMHYTVKLYEAMDGAYSGVIFDEIVTAALFHDVGKCRIADQILKKDGPFLPLEYEEMKQHARYTREILLPNYGEKIANIAGSHHERLNGSGYPLGLKEEEIPLGARFIAVADAFDAMTAGRHYSPARAMMEAAEELCSLQELYDPKITAILKQMVVDGSILDDPLHSLSE